MAHVGSVFMSLGLSGFPLFYQLSNQSFLSWTGSAERQMLDSENLLPTWFTGPSVSVNDEQQVSVFYHASWSLKDSDQQLKTASSLQICTGTDFIFYILNHVSFLYLLCSFFVFRVESSSLSRFNSDPQSLFTLMLLCHLPKLFLFTKQQCTKTI